MGINSCLNEWKEKVSQTGREALLVFLDVRRAKLTGASWDAMEKSPAVTFIPDPVTTDNLGNQLLQVSIGQTCGFLRQQNLRKKRKLIRSERRTQSELVSHTALRREAGSALLNTLQPWFPTTLFKHLFILKS